MRCGDKRHKPSGLKQHTFTSNSSGGQRSRLSATKNMPAFLPEARGKVVSLPFPASGDPLSPLVTKSQLPGTGMWVSLGHPSAHRTGGLVERESGGGGGHGDCSRQGTLASDLISFPSKPGPGPPGRT